MKSSLPFITPNSTSVVGIFWKILQMTISVSTFSLGCCIWRLSTINVCEENAPFYIKYALWVTFTYNDNEIATFLI